MTIIYLTMARMPGEKAHSIQIARMCSALAEAGVDVILITPRRGDRFAKKASLSETLRFYGLKTGFKHYRTPVPDFLGGSIRMQRLAWLFMSFVHTVFGALFYTFAKFFKGRLYVYCREPPVLVFLGLMFPWVLRKTIFEVHELPSYKKLMGRVFNSALKRVKLIVPISHYISKQLELTTGYDISPNVVVLPLGVDENLGLKSVKNEYVKKLLVTANNRKIVMYTGHLHNWKKPEFLVDMISHLQRNDVLLCFVGGSAEDISRIKKYADLRGVIDKLYFTGLVNPSDVFSFLKVADVLVHYSPPNSSFSPLKLFEYMLACKPILAPDAPGVNEVLTNDVNALLFDPVDPSDAALKLMILLDNHVLAEKLAENAYITVISNYTIKARVRRLLERLSCEGCR